MSTPSIKDLIKNNLSIPTLPDVVLRINKLIEDPDAGTAEIGALVSEDAPLAAEQVQAVFDPGTCEQLGLSPEGVSALIEFAGLNRNVKA